MWLKALRKSSFIPTKWLIKYLKCTLYSSIPLFSNAPSIRQSIPLTQKINNSKESFFGIRCLMFFWMPFLSAIELVSSWICYKNISFYQNTWFRYHAHKINVNRLSYKNISRLILTIYVLLTLENVGNLFFLFLCVLRVLFIERFHSNFNSFK